MAAQKRRLLQHPGARAYVHKAGFPLEYPGV